LSPGDFRDAFCTEATHLSAIGQPDAGTDLTRLLTAGCVQMFDNCLTLGQSGRSWWMRWNVHEKWANGGTEWKTGWRRLVTSWLPVICSFWIVTATSCGRRWLRAIMFRLSVRQSNQSNY